MVKSTSSEIEGGSTMTGGIPKSQESQRQEEETEKKTENGSITPPPPPAPAPSEEQTVSSELPSISKGEKMNGVKAKKENEDGNNSDKKQVKIAPPSSKSPAAATADESGVNSRVNETLGKDIEKPAAQAAKVKPKAPPKPAKKPTVPSIPSSASASGGNNANSNNKVTIPSASSSPAAALLSNVNEDGGGGDGDEEEESLKLYPNRSRNFPLIVSSNVNGGSSSRPSSSSGGVSKNHYHPQQQHPDDEDLFSSLSTQRESPLVYKPTTTSLTTSPTSTINHHHHRPYNNNANNYSHIANYYNTNAAAAATPLPSLNGTISSRQGGGSSPTPIIPAHHLPSLNSNYQKQQDIINSRHHQHQHPHPHLHHLANSQSNGHNPPSVAAMALNSSSSGHDARHNIRRQQKQHQNSQPPSSTTTTTMVNSVSPPTLSTGNRSHRDYQRLHRVGFLRGKARTDSYKVISFICGFFAAILLIMSLSSTEWLQAQGYRQGLFVYCVGKNETDSTVPFVTKPELATEGCHRIDLSVQGYTLVAAAFCVVSLLVDVFATLLTVMGLRCRDPNKKYKYYRIAVYVMALALVTVLVALVVYPVCFAQIMDGSKRPFWEFGWAYGTSWGASIFLFGGVILLLCDKESEEIYYKERTIVYADTNNKV